MTLDKHEAKVVREAAARAATPGPWEDALDTPEQVLRYLDTVMHSDDQAMRLGAYNRVALYVKQSATLRSTIEEQDAVIAGLDNALARMTAEADELEAERDAAKRLCDRWIDAQGFDPCGGPVDDIDWCIVNAVLVLEGSLPPDHDAVLHALCATPPSEGSEG